VPDLLGVPNRGETWSMPQMPVLDSGGIVSKPTIAMLSANSRPEAIVPLNRDGSIPGAGGGGPVMLAPESIRELGEYILTGSARMTAGGIDQASRRAGLDAHAGLGTVVG